MATLTYDEIAVAAENLSEPEPLGFDCPAATQP